MVLFFSSTGYFRSAERNLDRNDNKNNINISNTSNISNIRQQNEVKRPARLEITAPGRAVTCVQHSHHESEGAVLGERDIWNRSVTPDSLLLKQAAAAAAASPSDPSGRGRCQI